MQKVKYLLFNLLLLLNLTGCKSEKESDVDYGNDFRGTSTGCVDLVEGHCPSKQAVNSGEFLKAKGQPASMYLTWNVTSSEKIRVMQCPKCTSNTTILNGKDSTYSDLIRCRVDPFTIGVITNGPQSYTNKVVFDKPLPKGSNYIKITCNLQNVPNSERDYTEPLAVQ